MPGSKIKAKHKNYAGYGLELESSRIASHDLEYKEKDFLYYDTYLGGQCFSSEEAIWHQVYEEIFYCEEKIYDCYFHGGVIK